MTFFLACIAIALVFWWVLIAWDKITKPLDDQTPTQPCAACGQVEDEPGDYRCPVCRRTRSKYGLVDKP